MPVFFLPLVALLWRFKFDLVTAAIVVLAIVFASSSFDRYLVAGAVVASYLLGHSAGASK